MAKPARRRDMRVRSPRKQRKVRNRPPDMPRVVITPDTPLQPFIVAKSSLYDDRGEKCWTGDEAWLCQEKAEFLANLGYLKVEVKFDARSRPVAEVVRSPETDTTKTVATPAADSDGGESGGGAGSSNDDEAEGDGGTPRRRRARSEDA